jgi:serine/threonine protein kinase
MVEEINGSMLWMAPEIFLEKPRGCRSDIWSLGCTLIELFTAENPWPNIKTIEDVMLWVQEGKTP